MFPSPCLAQLSQFVTSDPHASGSCDRSVRDAWLHFGRSDPRRLAGHVAERVTIRGADVSDCDADGHCLYHALVRADGQGGTMQVRAELALFVAEHPGMEFRGATLADWLWWERQLTPQAYAERQTLSGFGGALELAIYAHSRVRNIHVWEPLPGGGYCRIACFDELHADTTLHLLFVNGNHYNVLSPHPGQLPDNRGVIAPVVIGAGVVPQLCIPCCGADTIAVPAPSRVPDLAVEAAVALVDRDDSEVEVDKAVIEAIAQRIGMEEAQISSLQASLIDADKGFISANAKVRSQAHRLQ